ncbi:MAG: hypothetical protein U5J63_16305 [Fodinibius sp.]|nr:hypothetical protein [Fodinibius sp.]
MSYTTRSHSSGTDNKQWRKPSSASATVSKTRGYNLYVFGDVSNDDRYNRSLPNTLSVQGQEHSGPTNLNVTYLPEADSGWNIVANPYRATINWDDNGSWTKTNMDNTIYVWDPDFKIVQKLEWNNWQPWQWTAAPSRHSG